MPFDDNTPIGLLPNGEMNIVGKGRRIDPLGSIEEGYAIVDATPRSLYVRRDVVNVADIKKWAKRAGFTSIRDDLHVTIMYSNVLVDWMKLGHDWAFTGNPKGEITINPGGVRIVENFGDAAVLLFTSGELSSRHHSIKHSVDTDWSYPDYQPHITISKADDVSAEMMNLIGAGKIEPYRGKIVLGPEIIEEVDVKWKESTVEDAKWA